MTLTGLSAKYGSDKHYACETGYTDFYEEIFSPFRNEPLRLLEIGIFEGASLKMWEEYFPQGKIFGIDINKDCLRHKTHNNEIFIGSQSDPEFLNRVGEVYGKFKIMIDDGSHVPDDQKVSFFELFKYLSHGGYYIIEDIHTSYWSDYTPAGMENTIDFFKNLVSEVKLFEMGHTFPNDRWQSHISSIEYILFHKGLIVVRKK